MQNILPAQDSSENGFEFYPRLNCIEYQIVHRYTGSVVSNWSVLGHKYYSQPNVDLTKFNGQVLKHLYQDINGILYKDEINTLQALFPYDLYQIHVRVMCYTIV